MTVDHDRSWVRGVDIELRPDPARVVAELFLPGQELAASGLSRSTEVLERVLGLSHDDVARELAALLLTFDAGHRDLTATWEAHSALVEHRLDDGVDISPARRSLIGAYFTREVSIEGAALCNPSMAPHPDQSGIAPGSTRFVMTVRAVGEGHLSSVELRTGIIDEHAVVSLDPLPDAATLPSALPSSWSRAAFADQLRDMWGDHTNSDFVLDTLPETFDRADLDAALAQLHSQRLTRGAAARTIDRFEFIAACSYSVEFAEATLEQERVLMPRSPSESRGMEDVRLVRFVDDDGQVDYLGTYTAYDGNRIALQLMVTRDFRRFDMTRLAGPGSQNKGLALFPRRIGGRYVALSRSDRESNGVTWSDDLCWWSEPALVQTPTQDWELVQLGNCGPPIETDHGWLVLTHGVGPMRQYSIGAILLDLDDPTRVVGRLRRPLLGPEPNSRSGYVPNVVYSCGGMLHGSTLVLPYGCNDATIRMALISLEPLLAELVASPDGETDRTSEETP
jgi:predicted GH43/DUF377 family glycosyl hydrolase